jgi:hypothetical protein
MKIFIFILLRIIFYVDVKELNNVLITSGHTKVDEDDDIDEHQFNEEDYDGYDDDKIEEEEEEEEEEYNFD